jgi:hypothetical protein
MVHDLPPPAAVMAQPSQRPATKNVCKTRGCIYSFWVRDDGGVCRPKHVEPLRNTGIINCTTRLHLVSSFYEIYITMHGSMNIKRQNTYVFRHRAERNYVSLYVFVVLVLKVLRVFILRSTLLSEAVKDTLFSELRPVQ